MANETSLPTHIPSLQVSVLDLFFPGITGISAAAEQLLAGRLNTTAHVLLFCGILLYLAKRVSQHVWQLVNSHLTSTVQVLNPDEAYDMLIAWVSTQTFAHNARSFLARIGRRRLHADSDETERKPLSYSPWNGTYPFFWNNRLYWFRSQQEDRAFRQEVVHLSCLGRSPKALHELLSHCRAEYLNMTRNKTSIFEPADRKWKQVNTRTLRRMSTVIMNKKAKAALLKDIEAYVDPKARAWYSNRGFPHQKGYLLHGPPGTGKSSLSLALAGHFRLDIYMLNLSCAKGRSLSELFAELPPRCVLLLEDVDAVNMTRSRQAATEETDTEDSCAIGGLSLSELLNVLDGVMSHEGRILIMTTNHIDRLDPALIRPGRVDKIIELPYADKEVTAQLFCMVFKRSEHDIPDPEKPADDDETVERLANDFANAVPGREFSPAEIQSFLVENRDSPHEAVQNVQEWMTRTREARTKRAGYLASAAVVAAWADETSNASSRDERQDVPTPLSPPPRAPENTVDRRMSLPDRDSPTMEAVRAAMHSPTFGVVPSESSSDLPRKLQPDGATPPTDPVSGQRLLPASCMEAQVLATLRHAIVTAIEKIGSAKSGPNTPPPSESGESTDDSTRSVVIGWTPLEKEDDQSQRGGEDALVT